MTPDVRGAGATAALRAAWLGAAAAGQLDHPPAPQIENVTVEAPDLARFDLAFGRGLVRLDFDPPQPGTSWPRWSRSLRVGPACVYGIGSTCGTCELFLRLVAWPEPQLAAIARALETRDLAHGLAPWIQTWHPLLSQLRSGPYLIASLVVPVERVDEANVTASWFNRRNAVRAAMADADDPYEDSGELASAGTVHYQGPQSGPPPTYPVIVPTQDPAKLDAARVAHHRRAIAGGARPPVVAIAWLDERHVEMRYEERFLVLVVLNGHHRLEAYAREAVAAPIVAIARVSDSWGPPDDPERFLRAAFAPLAAGRAPP